MTRESGSDREGGGLREVQVRLEVEVMIKTWSVPKKKLRGYQMKVRLI